MLRKLYCIHIRRKINVFSLITNESCLLLPKLQLIKVYPLDKSLIQQITKISYNIYTYSNMVTWNAMTHDCTEHNEKTLLGCGRSAEWCCRLFFISHFMGRVGGWDHKWTDSRNKSHSVGSWCTISSSALRHNTIQYNTIRGWTV